MSDTTSDIPVYARGMPTTWTMKVSSAGDTITPGTTLTRFATRPTLKANSFRVGQVLLGNASGVLSSALLSNLGITVGLRLGSGTVGISTTSLSLPLLALSNRSWYCQFQMTILSLGTSGTIECQGYVGMENQAVGGTLIAAPMPSNNVLAFNTTIDNELSMGAAFTAANASNSAKLRAYRVSLLQPIGDNNLMGMLL